MCGVGCGVNASACRRAYGVVVKVELAVYTACALLICRTAIDLYQWLKRYKFSFWLLLLLFPSGGWGGERLRAVVVSLLLLLLLLLLLFKRWRF